MKIHTYFNDIGFHGQEDIIAKWESNWRNAGFEPVVLKIDDAKANPHFGEYAEEIHRAAKDCGYDMSDYAFSCFARWLAYANQTGEAFYVSDYDVFNAGLAPDRPSDKLHFMDGRCPCLVSGSPSQFLELCFMFSTNWSPRRCGSVKSFHDQAWLMKNYSLLVDSGLAIFDKKDTGLDGRAVHLSTKLARKQLGGIEKVTRGMLDSAKLKLILEFS